MRIKPEDMKIVPDKPLNWLQLDELRRMAEVYSDSKVGSEYLRNAGSYVFARRREDFITDVMVAMPELLKAYQEKLKREEEAAEQRKLRWSP